MDIEEYSKYKQPKVNEISELLLKYLKKSNWKVFLDLGCGDGSLLEFMDKNSYFKNKIVYAVDLSEKRINLVKKINNKFLCYIDDACNAKNISDDSIDFLVSSQLIEHVPSDEKMAMEMVRVLKNGGIAYISTIFKKWYGWYFYRSCGKWTIDPTHLREYNKDHQLLDILKRCGFEILEQKKIQETRKIFGFRIPVPGYYIWEIICQNKK